jgi:hypothetical protein
LQLKPIAAGLYKATLTMSRAMRDKLRRAKDLLGYRKMMPDEAEILETGLDLFIAQQEALDHDELMPGLRNLGFTKEEARFALRESGPMAGQGLEARLKRCLAVLAPPHRNVLPNGAVATWPRTAASGSAAARRLRPDVPGASPRCPDYRNQLSGFIGAEPLRTSKCSIGPLSDPVSPERPMTVPAATSVPVEAFTSERWL